MPARIVLDARKVGDGGIGSYLENLVCGFQTLKEHGELCAEVVLLVPPSADVSAHVRETIDSWSMHCTCVEESSGKYSVAEYYRIPQVHGRVLQAASVYHSPHLTLPYRLPCPSVVTIHDTLLLTHASSARRRAIAKYLLGSAIKRASGVLTVSEHSRRQLLAHFPTTKASHIQVIHNAVSPRVRASTMAANRFSAGVQRVLWIGNEKRHKGLSLFLDAISIVRQEAQAPSLEVEVVVPQLSGETRARASSLGVRVRSALSAVELRECYDRASLLVLSSYEEGCGLPALEACAQGIPVVTTPLPSVYEMCGDVPYYSTAFTGDALAECIQEVFCEMSSVAQRERLQTGVAQLESVTPETQARRTLLYYDFLLVKHGSDTFFCNTDSRINGGRHSMQRSVG